MNLVRYFVQNCEFWQKNFNSFWFSDHRVSEPKKIVTCEQSVRCYVKSSTLSNERKNKWALPPGAIERPFGPICAILAYLLFGARWKCPLIFSLIWNSRRFYITYKKWKKSDGFLASYANLKVRPDILHVGLNIYLYRYIFKRFFARSYSVHYFFEFGADVLVVFTFSDRLTDA